MIEWIITSCVLIVIVLLLRFALKGRISLGLQYALWALVLVRLLIPVNFFSSPMSVMNAVSEPESVPAPVVELPQEITPTEQMDLELPQPQLPQVDYSAPAVEQTPVQPTVSVIPDLETQNTPIVEQTPTLSLKQILLGIWLLGMAVCCVVIAAANIRFALRLKRSRQKVKSDCRLPVYSTGIIDTPCLFGIFCPAIYLTAEELEEGQKLHVLTHELTHYRHLDHIWALLRSLCLVLHWYNPLVWVAAVLSRRDAELACDEATIRRLGEDSRAEYGKTLIRMTCAKQEFGSILTTATTMTGSKKTITQRIKLIAKHPKTAAFAIICVVLVAAIAVGCTFTGAKSSEELDASTETTPEEIETPEGETEPEETTIPKEETAIVTDKRAAEVLTKSYSLKDLRAFMDDEEFFYSDYAFDQSQRMRKLCLSDVHDKFPIECIKVKYIVYSVEEGGYFYVFPDILTPYEVGEQVVLSETNVADTVYVSGVCDLSDFDSIEVGKSTFQDVKDIDPNIEGYYSSDDDYDILRSHSPLSDGSLLDISYKRNDDTNSEIVVDMQINPINYEPSPYWWTRIQYEDWPGAINETMYPKVFECAEVEGYVTKESLDTNTPCKIFVRKYRNIENPYIYDLFIVVETENKVLEKQLESNVFQLPASGLFLGDVDGDKVQEILIHHNTGGNGGYGLWQTWVLKVEDGAIHILFEDFDEFDTGFESQFLEDYRLKITNRFTGYELVFDVKDGHKKAYKSAKEPPTGYALLVDPFCHFEPEDVDQDGISEIVCSQYTSQFSHMDNTGTAHSILKFNTNTQKFEVIDAWYEPYIPAKELPQDEVLQLLRKQMDVPHSYVIEQVYNDYLYYEYSQTTTQEMALDGSWYYKVERSYEYPLQDYSSNSTVEFYYVYEDDKLVCYLKDQDGKISSQVIDDSLLEQIKKDGEVIDSGYTMYPQYLTDFQHIGTDEETGLECYTFNLSVENILKETSLASQLIELSMESYKTTYKDIYDLNVQCTVLADPITMQTISYKMDFEELKPYVLSDGAISAEYALPFLELFYVKYTFDYQLEETTVLPDKYK